MNPRRVRMVALLVMGLALAGVALRVITDVERTAAAALHPAYPNPPASVLAAPPPGASPGEFTADVHALLQWDEFAWALLAMLLVTGLVTVLDPPKLRLMGVPWLCLAGYLLSVAPAAYALARDVTLSWYAQVRFVGVLLEEVALAGMGAVFVTEVFARVTRRAIPKILSDIVLVGLYLAIGLSLLSRAGFNVSGIIATSAVLTAVIGFSLQDTLSNLMSGLVLEVEDQVNVGDWVKVGDVEGQVTQIRWRQTTIQTRNWDVAVVPNSVLMKSPVLVYGTRDGRRVPHRQWIHFQVDLSTPPSDVLAVVSRALAESPVENVAREPAPNCVMTDFREGVGAYAVRYFIEDIAPNDPTDTRVRERVYFALQRAGMRLAAPQRALAVTEDTPEHRAARDRRDHDRRVAALRKVDLLRVLEPRELDQMAEGLRHAPFGPREVITRQGDASDCMYFVVRGRAAVSVVHDGLEKKVAEIGGGSLFGEMGVLTGEPRSATVTALEAMDCWAMDRDLVQSIITRRPEIAQGLSAILAERKVNLEAARSDLERDVEKSRELRTAQDDILRRISKFLGLKSGA